jgi:phage gpG-like protein
MGLKGNYKRLDKSIKALDSIASGELTKKITKAIGGEFLDLTLEGFTSSRDPYGNAWADLKYRDGQPLRDKGHLASGFNLQVSDLQFTIQNPVKYGVHHQFGAPKAHIPARPMLPKSGTLPDAWSEVADEAALEAIQNIG